MDCVRCNRPFVTGERPLIPKVLPCGHTVCLGCLREQLPVSECPIAACRQVFNGPPEELPTNLALVNVLNVMVRDSQAQGPYNERLLLFLRANIARLVQAARPAEVEAARKLVNFDDIREGEQHNIAADIEGVTRLFNVRCHEDPVEILEMAAPTVQELSLVSAQAPHFRALESMPRLWRLEISGAAAQEGHSVVQQCEDGGEGTSSGSSRTPLVNHGGPVEPPSSVSRQLPERSSLRWLRALGLPYDTLQSLLRRHANTLQELQLGVGPEEDLLAILGDCAALKPHRVILVRECNNQGKCDEQLRDVQRLLSTLVLCEECDQATVEEF